MKIRIKQDAAAILRATRKKNGASQPDEYRYIRELEAIQGMTFDIDTSMLFNNNFVVLPGQNIYSDKDDLNVDSEYVEEIIDDVRIGLTICEYCGAIYEECRSCL